MVAHHHDLDLRIGQHAGAALAFFLESQPAILVVDHHAVIEGGAILVDRRQAAVLQAGKHGGVDRMHMHDAAGVRTMPMDRAVQAPCGRVRCAGTAQHVWIVRIQFQQVRGLDAGEMHLVRVHQELRAVVIGRQREMVRHRLMHVEPRGPAESGGEIDALRPVAEIAFRGEGDGRGHSVAPGGVVLFWAQTAAPAASSLLQKCGSCD